MSLEYKTTGTLFDELFTADLKVKHWPDDAEVSARRHALGNIIQGRLLRFHEKTNWERIVSREVWEVAERLKSVLEECWNAQEVVMQFAKKSAQHISFPIGDLQDVATAAIIAQRTNAERNKLIRAIDDILGESENTQLRKTYAE